MKRYICVLFTFIVIGQVQGQVTCFAETAIGSSYNVPIGFKLSEVAVNQTIAGCDYRSFGGYAWNNWEMSSKGDRITETDFGLYYSLPEFLSGLSIRIDANIWAYFDSNKLGTRADIVVMPFVNYSTSIASIYYEMRQLFTNGSGASHVLKIYRDFEVHDFVVSPATSLSRLDNFFYIRGWGALQVGLDLSRDFDVWSLSASLFYQESLNDAFPNHWPWKFAVARSF